MLLDHLNATKKQIGFLSGLDHLIARGDLGGQLKAFLLSCRVDELSPRTLGDYEQKIGRFVYFAFSLKVTQPNKVTANHVRMFLLKCQETCIPYSVRDYYGCVKRFFNWMISEGVLKSNPMAPIRRPKVPEKLIQPFKPEHINELLYLCSGTNLLSLRNQAIILIYYDTGLRLSEISKIQLKDIDFDREIIKVMGKGAKERVVRVGKRTQKTMLRYLLMRKDNYPCLWVSEEGRPMHVYGIQSMIKRLGYAAKFNDVRCSSHTFRHSFGTQCLRNGATVKEVQDLLGHSTARMTMRYVATLNSEDAAISHRRFSPVDNLKL